MKKIDQQKKIEELEHKILNLTYDLQFVFSQLNKFDTVLREQRTQSTDFPSIADINYSFKTYKFSGIIKDPACLLKLTLTGKTMSEMKSDFRYKNSTNHKLYLKVDGPNETKWLNCSEIITPLGIINKDNCPCLHKNSSVDTRICHILKDTSPDNVVYIRFGIPIDAERLEFPDMTLEVLI